MEETIKENGSNGRAEQVDLSLLMDVPLQVTVELGRGAFDHRKSAQTQSRLRGGTESSDRRTTRYLGE